MNRVAVIVLNWNGIDDTVLCFRSLLRQTAKNFVIVIVDNGSKDGSKATLEKMERDYPKKLVVLRNPYNKGFAGGVNTGIEWATSQNFDGVALFNNDAQADNTWLQHLIEGFKDRQIGIVTGLLLSADGKHIDSTGEQYSKWGLAFPRNRNDLKESAPKAEYVFGATGGASLYRLSMLHDIGLFDEDFFAYYEDVDISFRAQLSGWKVFYQPSAIAYHQKGGTSSKIAGFTIYQAFKNLPLVYIKNVPRLLLLPIGIRFYTAYWLMYFKAILHGNLIPATKGLVQSMWYGLSGLRKRRDVQKNRKVPVKYIESILWHDLPPDQTGLRRVRKLFTGK